jgi:2-O-methyltransferase
VTLFETAIGAEDGHVEFHVSSGLPQNMHPQHKAQYPEGWDQSGSIKAPKTHVQVWPWVKFDQKTKVPLQRLDSWAAAQGISKVDIIWADTQGAEADVIKGGLKTLEATRLFYTEYSNDEWYEGQPTLLEVMDLLPNFDLVSRYQMDALFRNKADR